MVGQWHGQFVVGYEQRLGLIAERWLDLMVCIVVPLVVFLQSLAQANSLFSMVLTQRSLFRLCILFFRGLRWSGMRFLLLSCYSSIWRVFCSLLYWRQQILIHEFLARFACGNP